MPSLNQVMVMGHLGHDPEVKHLTNGDPVANVSVATSEKWRDRATGEMREKTEWHRIVCFGQPAQFLEQYARKGALVLAIGKMQYRQYEDRDGMKRTIAEVVAREIKLFGGSREEGAAQPAEDRPARPATDLKAKGTSTLPIIDDDIPF